MSKDIEPHLQPAPVRRKALVSDDREYEQSGLYPPGQKPFRLFRLMGFLLVVIVFIIVTSYLLDKILI